MQVEIWPRVEVAEKTLIEQGLLVWEMNKSVQVGGEEVALNVEVSRILSRGYTDACVFFANYWKVSGTRGDIHSRVFKIDQKERIGAESRAVRVLQDIGGNFFCNIRNTPEQDSWKSEDKEYSIIEYYYASYKRDFDPVTSAEDFLESEFHPGDDYRARGQNMTEVLRPVVTALKKRVYGNPYIGGYDVSKFLEKLNDHFGPDNAADTIASVLEDDSRHAGGLLKDVEPGQLADRLLQRLRSPVKYFAAEMIHGDLNPTNILIYEDDGIRRSILIDFYEMQNKQDEGFTPYFWDFARLEGEFVLQFFLDPDRFDNREIGELGPRLFQLLLNGRQPEPSDSEEFRFIFHFIERLRACFFEPDLEVTVNFASIELVKNYYKTLFVFYLHIMKYRESDYGRRRSAVALYFARYLANEIIPRIKIAPYRGSETNAKRHAAPSASGRTTEQIRNEIRSHQKRLENNLFEYWVGIFESNVMEAYLGIGHGAAMVQLRGLELEIDKLQQLARLRRVRWSIHQKERELDARNQKKLKRYSEDLTEAGKWIGAFRIHFDPGEETENYRDLRYRWIRVIRKLHPDLNPAVNEGKHPETLRALLEQIVDRQQEPPGSGLDPENLSQVENAVRIYEQEHGVLRTDFFMDFSTDGLLDELDRLQKRNAQVERKLEATRGSEFYLLRERAGTAEFTADFHKHLKEKIAGCRVLIDELTATIQGRAY